MSTRVHRPLSLPLPRLLAGAALRPVGDPKIARGVGSAAGAGDGLKQAWDAMRAAVDNGTRVLCKAPG